MRTNWLPELGANNHSRPLGRWTSCKQHNASARILERGFHQANGDAQRNTRAAEIATIISNGPRVFLKILQCLGELELGILDRQKES